MSNSIEPSDSLWVFRHSAFLFCSVREPRGRRVRHLNAQGCKERRRRPTDPELCCFRVYSGKKSQREYVVSYWPAGLWLSSQTVSEIADSSPYSNLVPYRGPCPPPPPAPLKEFPPPPPLHLLMVDCPLQRVPVGLRIAWDNSAVFLNLGVATPLGSPSDFRGVARLPTNFLKNDIRTEKCRPNSPTYSTDVGVLRGWGRAQITVRHFGSRGKKGWETLA